MTDKDDTQKQKGSAPKMTARRYLGCSKGGDAKRASAVKVTLPKPTWSDKNEAD